MIATLYRRLLTSCGVLAGASFALIAVATAYDVFARNVFGESVRGLVDIVEYALFVTTFVAAPWVLREGAHVRVDFAVNALPPVAHRRVGHLTNAIGLAISVVLLVYSTRVTIAAWQQGSMVLKAVVFPEWWVFVVMPFSSLLFAIEFTIRLGERRTVRAASGL